MTRGGDGCTAPRSRPDKPRGRRRSVRRTWAGNRWKNTRSGSIWRNKRDTHSPLLGRLFLQVGLGEESNPPPEGSVFNQSALGAGGRRRLRIGADRFLHHCDSSNMWKQKRVCGFSSGLSLNPAKRRTFPAIPGLFFFGAEAADRFLQVCVWTGREDGTARLVCANIFGCNLLI